MHKPGTLQKYNSVYYSLEKYWLKEFRFEKYIDLDKYTLEIKVLKLLGIAFRQYIMSRDPRTPCNGPETPTT